MVTLTFLFFALLIVLQKEFSNTITVNQCYVRSEFFYERVSDKRGFVVVFKL